MGIDRPIHKVLFAFGKRDQGTFIWNENMDGCEMNLTTQARMMINKNVKFVPVTVIVAMVYVSQFATRGCGLLYLIFGRVNVCV